MKPLFLIFIAVAFSQIPLARAGEKIDWSTRPDFDKLRQEIGARKNFVDTCDINDDVVSEMQVYAYLNNEDWEGGAMAADTRLQNCPVDIQMHLYAGIALQRMEQHAAAQHHFDWYWGLVDSILRSGDGKTPETAYVTISIAEEYSALSALGMQMRWQSTEGNRDVFFVVDQEGVEQKVYFFPDLHWRRMIELVEE